MKLSKKSLVSIGDCFRVGKQCPQKAILMKKDPIGMEVQTGHILIADDDADFRRILCRRVERLGFTYDEAENGDQALELLRTHEFDVLLLDLYMPSKNGLDVVQEAQQFDSDLQAIILTGGATVETAVEALRAGVYDYLTKPLDSLTQLDITLTHALERRRLVRENAHLFAEVQRLAITDPLTGIYNRRKVDQVLPDEVERARRYNRPLSLIMLDLDNLKRINDRHGHSTGDQMLKYVANIIRNEVRSVDVPARIGGDEFLILLPEADLEAASRVAKRVCSRISGEENGEVNVSVSVGVVQWSRELASADDFLQVVDQAMYQAKRAGGRRMFVLSPAPIF
jgi:two-component system cell cycle response regulator